MPPFIFRSAAFVSVLLLMILFTPLPTWGQDSLPPEYSRGDPDKYTSAKECGKCHELEFELWKTTKHADQPENQPRDQAEKQQKEPKKLHERSKTKKILKKLGFLATKRDSLCIACHYTPVKKRGHLSTTSGVSCEACHGPGKDWINIHNDYGGEKLDYQTESPEHRAKRIKDSRQAGMKRPSDLYPVVENCFQCHLVPNEKLVNVGGHGTGTGDFEFVAMANKIRHNFLRSLKDGNQENAVRPIERRRLMYIVGQTVQLEYVLRSLAVATKEGTYASSMIDRVADAMADMSDLSSLIQVSELKNLGEIVEEEALKPNNKSLLLKAAARVSAATKLFLKNHDGSKLSALDSEAFNTDESEETDEASDDESGSDPEEIEESPVALDPPKEPEERVDEHAGTKKGKTEIQTELSQNSGPLDKSPAISSGSPQNDQVASVIPDSNRVEAPIQSEPPMPLVVVPPVESEKKIPARKTQAKLTPVRSPSKQPRQRLRPTVVGKKKNPIRPVRLKHRTVGPRSCGKCHGEQTEWWLDDKHKKTHKPFTAKKGEDHEKAVKIAKLYGVKPSEMAKGTQVCMNCHGTVISKKKKKKVRSGVSCESCHGPAKTYLKPHEDIENDSGPNGPGYIKSLKLGLVKLKDEAVRARTCASCHYITDKRLISSGHSSGEKFKYAERVKDIKHWEKALASPVAMTKAYAKVLASRGPVPTFAVAPVAETENRRRKARPLETKKVPSEATGASPTTIIPTKAPSTQIVPVSPGPSQEQKSDIVMVPPVVQPPVQQLKPEPSPIPVPEKDPKRTGPVISEIDESPEEDEFPEEEEETENETPEPDEDEGVNEQIIRDALIAIDDTIKKLNFEDIHFDAPLAIQVNETYPIALTLPPGETIKELNLMIKKYANKMGLDSTVVGRMEARLSGRNFSISTINPETQTLGEGDPTEWKWEVTPTKEGSQKLHVSLSAWISVGGKSTLKEIRTFDQKVEISAGVVGKVKDMFLNNWQWIWAIVFFSGIAWWRGKKST